MTRRWLLLAAIVLAACGQKGPLYLPGESSGRSIPIAVPSEATDPADTTPDGTDQDDEPTS